MNLNQLRVFAQVASEGSITAAARSLHISQPAVSKQLGELENTLGCALVDRLPRGIRLTESGKLLESYAQRIFQLEGAAERDLSELMGLGRGRLAIGASTTVGSYLLPAALAKFAQNHPAIEIHLEIGNTRQIEALVRDGLVELGFTEGLVNDELLDSSDFAEDELILIARPLEPLIAGKTLSPSKLAGVPILMREEGSGSRAVVEAALREFSIYPTVSISLGSTEAIKNAVLSGLGIAFLPRLAVGHELEHGLLHEIPIQGFKLERKLHLVTARSRQLSPAAQSLLTVISAAKS